MKRKVLLLTVLLSLLGLVAQARFHIGIRGGIGGTRLKVKNGNTDLKTDHIFTWEIGGAFNYAWALPAGQIELEGRLQFERIGGKWVFNNNQASSTVSLYYFDIPVLALYRYDFTKQVGVYVGAGLQFNFGMVGYVEDDEVEWGDDALKRFMMDVKFEGGMHFLKHYRVGLFYDLGVTDMYDATNYDGYNRRWGAAFTYYFF
ncbi:MAG: hypothetical protein CSA97_01480 [Bacteroidetes bacterium]|nr:MAG: hypothetical protein CSA97_01480 [Bacteroidota bacterium]